MTELGYPTELINPIIMWFATPSIVTTMQEQENIFNSADEGHQNFNDTLEQDNESLQAIEEQLNSIYENAKVSDTDESSDVNISNIVEDEVE